MALAYALSSQHHAPMPTIHTPRLVLRPARTGDAEAMFAVMREPLAMRYWSTPPHTDIAQTHEFLNAMMTIPDGEGEDFVVEHEGRLIGKAGLYRFPAIGYILAREHWGKGLAKEALTAVIARAFTVHRLPGITADVDPRNAASLGLLNRLGFFRSGFRSRSWLVGDEWCDSIDLVLEQEAWKARADSAKAQP